MAACVSGGRTCMTESVEVSSSRQGRFCALGSIPSPGWAWLGLHNEPGKGELLRKSLLMYCASVLNSGGQMLL